VDCTNEVLSARRSPHLKNHFGPEGGPSKRCNLAQTKTGGESDHRAVMTDVETHLEGLPARLKELEVHRELLEHDAERELVVDRRVLRCAPDIVVFEVADGMH